MTEKPLKKPNKFISEHKVRETYSPTLYVSLSPLAFLASQPLLKLSETIHTRQRKAIADAILFRRDRSSSPLYSDFNTRRNHSKNLGAIFGDTFGDTFFEKVENESFDFDKKSRFFRITSTNFSNPQ